MTEEGEEDSLLVLAEAVLPSASSGGIGPLEVYGNNLSYGAEENYAPILLSGRTLNKRSEDMVELCRQWIAIDYDNNPAPDNVPRQGVCSSSL